MALFYWKDEYSVSIEEIDRQHKTLVEMINELHSSMLSGKGKDVLGPIFKGLVEYTTTHFKTEEDLMSRHLYPELTEHKEKHTFFINKINDYATQFESGNLLISIELMNFLKDWLISHIAGMDKKYSSFFSDKGIQ
jgi:hemerythrin